MAELAVLASTIAAGAAQAATATAGAIGTAASAAAPYAGLAATAATVGGTVLEGVSAKNQAEADARAGMQAAEIQKRSLEAKAAEERAAAGREAQEKRKEGELLKSRQVALAASSGGGTANPTILDILGDTESRTSYLANSAVYGGEQRAAGLKDQANFGTWQAKTQAASSKAKGDAAFSGSLLEGFGAAAEGIYRFKKDRAYG
jgi:hypothetical protein